MSDDGWRPWMLLLGDLGGPDPMCRHCLTRRSAHTGPFLACPDRQEPEPGEQLWLDDRLPHQTQEERDDG